MEKDKNQKPVRKKGPNQNGRDKSGRYLKKTGPEPVTDCPLDKTEDPCLTDPAVEITSGKERDEAGRFVEGVSGNPKGRPPGSRQILSQQFISDLFDDYVEHGQSVIANLREKNPKEYCRIIIRTFPKNIEDETGKLADAFMNILKSISDGAFTQK